MNELIGDISHYQDHVSLSQFSSLRGIIHKATEGTGLTDDFYVARYLDSLDTDLLWGAYHFGRNLDPKQQVEFFLNVVKPIPGVLLALDLEQSMSLSEAEQFVEEVNRQIGRYPLVYTSRSYMNRIDPFPHSKLSTALSQCELWVANYGEANPIVPPQWESATLWQYTDGVINGAKYPMRLPQTPSCDLSVYLRDEPIEEWWGE